MIKQTKMSFSTTQDSPRSSTRKSSLSRALQQRGRFFQLEYLFGEPNANQFHPHQNRQKHHKNIGCDSTTLDLSSGKTSEFTERLPMSAIPIKDLPKTAEESSDDNKTPLQIGEQGLTIHNKRCQCWIRTRSSLNEDRKSQQTLKKHSKKGEREQFSNGSKLALTLQKPTYHFISVNARGVRYSQRTPLQKRQNHAQRSTKKQSPPVSKIAKGVEKRLMWRQHPLFRPWSPDRSDNGIYLGFQDTLHY